MLTQWGLPAFRALITFRFVHIIGHCNQLRVAQIVGKLLALGCCPRRSTRLYIIDELATRISIEPWQWERKETDLPCVGERNQVVYIYVAGGRPCRTVVGTEPATTCCGAGRTLHHICTIALQHHLSCIAAPGLNDPMGEEGPTVTSLWALRGDLESRKSTLGGSCRRDVGRCRHRS